MRRFTAQGTNTGFTCLHCGEPVPPLQNGSYRNHCPVCLYSLHVDIFPGDRANPCQGLLEPVGAEYSGKKGWVIVHRCARCGELRRNKAALDDATPDDFGSLVALTQRTHIAQPGLTRRQGELMSATPSTTSNPPENLQVTRDGALLKVALNRPEVLNALTPELLTELRAALELAEADEVRAVLLTGEGRGFCSGADLDATAIEGSAEEVVETFYNPVVRALMGLPKPVVAAVNGVAAGAGMSLALACDLRLLSENAAFALGFSRIGLVMDAAMSYTLPRLVGPARALELAYSGRKLGAGEAKALGLGELILPAEGFAEAATTFAKTLSEGPTQSYARIKMQVAASLDNTLEAQLALEARLQGEASRTEDFSEGLHAFGEKRAPQFRGR